MMVTSTGWPARRLAAASPPKPAPTISTRGRWVGFSVIIVGLTNLPQGARQSLVSKLAVFTPSRPASAPSVRAGSRLTADQTRRPTARVEGAFRLLNRVGGGDISAHRRG